MRLREAGKSDAPNLINIFLVDEELPFETAFWEQPAKLMDRFGPPPALFGNSRRPTRVVEGMLGDLVEEFDGRNAADRARCMLAFPDGELMDSDALESLAEDARLR